MSIFPDGSNTYCGQIIHQNGEVFEFDIDLDSNQYSSVKDITKYFKDVVSKKSVGEPWAKEVVAYKLFFDDQHHNT